MDTGPDYGDDAAGPDEGDACCILAAGRAPALALLEYVPQGSMGRARAPPHAAPSRTRGARHEDEDEDESESAAAASASARSLEGVYSYFYCYTCRGITSHFLTDSISLLITNSP